MSDNVNKMTIHLAAANIHTNILIYELRAQMYQSAFNRLSWVTEKIEAILLLSNDCNININQEFLLTIIENMFINQQNSDYVLLADICEVQLLPYLYELLEGYGDNFTLNFDFDNYINNIDELSKTNPGLDKLLKSMPDPRTLFDKGYTIEPTSCGIVTLARESNGIKRYLHSNVNALWEGYQLADAWYSDDKNEYIIYGLGMGYHVWQLAFLNEFINVEVYESDINIIQLLCAYHHSGISFLTKPNIKIIYDPDFTRLMKRLRKINIKREVFEVHFPSLRYIENDEIKKQIENFFNQQASMKNQLRFLNNNFSANIMNYDGFVDDLKDKFSGKDLYIVAAGPSLDKNFIQLKQLKNKGIILATGTVFRKLLNAGIIPDYFIVIDALEKVYGQILGYENLEVPMIYLSTAYKGFAEKYRGPKYIVCQKDFEKAEVLAKERGKKIYQTGGSVSTAALDIGISLGCKRIIFLGLDLAYTNDFVHASDTSLRELSNKEDLRQVEDINGNLIYTGKNLDSFRIWIENRIKDIKDIEFIDATEGGAKITGMKIMQLSDYINRSNHITEVNNKIT